MLSLRFYIICFLGLFGSEIQAMRVDSFSIKHSRLELRIRNFSSKTISGSTSHYVHFKLNTNTLTLDLRQLSVDSVYVAGNKTNFNRSGEKLQIDLNQIYGSGDSCLIKVYYRGTPAADPGGWGGFYFSGDYAYNLGVGFSVNPHSFGRAWYPCVDEFPMKSSYEFLIETDSSFTAACNGLLLSNTVNGDARIWHYLETVPMSAYLVSVSVSKFSVLKSNFNGIEKQFPLALYCKTSDTLKVKTSFAKLPQAISAFEMAFGPQIFSKVGYNFVPFTAGAMEHAGNITYPSAYANGNTDYEQLMAHELSHHWWGNNVTCESEGDMWLNEGWASYCEHFFLEQVYGKSVYKSSILANHVNVLRFAHINDNNVFSMTNIPSQYTYGNHVYKKGASVVHSLRGVVGDSIFFKSCKSYQADYRLKNASSKTMEDVFAANGGGNIARSFFENWVFEKGFPHVILRRQVHSGNGPFHLKILTEQNPRFTDKIYKNLPVEVFFFRDRIHFEKRTVVLQNEIDSFSFSFNFKPVFVCLDYDEKLSDAISERTVHSDTTGLFDLPESLAKLYILKNSDSALIRLEHHWVGPEKFRVTRPYMSDYRYYTLDGIWTDSLKMDVELIFDGRQGGPNSNTGYLDHTLIFKTEDSLTVLFRAFPGDHWRVWPNIQFSIGSKNDKQGRAMIKNAVKGDYVFAMYDHSLSAGNADDFQEKWNVYPNPGNHKIQLSFESNRTGLIEIYDLLGNLIYSVKRNSGTNEIVIDTRNLADGLYTLRYSGEGFEESRKIRISH